VEPDLATADGGAPPFIWRRSTSLRSATPGSFRDASTLATLVLNANVQYESWWWEVPMNRKIETSESKVYRPARRRDILCRLTYEVTPFRDGLCRWFLLSIEELE